MAKFEKKYTTEQVIEIFAREGCELISKFERVDKILDYRCSCGRQSKIRLFSFIKGSRCAECGRQKMRESRRLPFSEVIACFELAGYKMISTEYFGNHLPLECICPRQHVCNLSYGNFRTGTRCKQCFVEDKMVGANNPNYDPDRVAVAERLKFRRMCKSLVSRTLKAIGTEKIKRSEELLGYSCQQLKEHLKCGLDNCSVDHIFPIKAFIDYGIQDVSLINSLDNLRTIPLTDNLKKNAKYDKSEFENYLIEKGIKWI